MAEDIGQETFTRFHKALHTFRGKAHVWTYLSQIAINLALTELKKQKRHQIFSFFQGNKDLSLINLPHQYADPDRKDTQAMVQVFWILNFVL